MGWRTEGAGTSGRTGPLASLLDPAAARAVPGTGQPVGLTTADAAARLARWGPNELDPPRRFEAVREIARHLTNPLVLILLLASGISAAFGLVEAVKGGFYR